MLELTTNEKRKLIEERRVTEEIFRSYIEYLDVAEKTIETYTKALKQLAYYLNINKITQPTRNDLLNFKELLKEKNKPTTIQNYIVAIRLFFKWTEQQGLYPNIAEHLKGAKLDREHKKDYLTAKQIKGILSNMPIETEQDKRDFALFVLMVTGGLRTIEVSRANVEDLRALGNDTALYIQGKGKQEKTDYIKIPTEAETAIRNYLKARGKIQDNEPLFSSTSNNSKGQRLSTRTISGIIKEIFRKNGYDNERLTAHSLRHTAITLSLLSGMDITEVQQYARHQNISTTMIYNHALDKAKNKCSQAVSNAIFSN